MNGVADPRPDFDTYTATLPTTVVGVEHEYKWLLPDDRHTDPAALIDRLGLPAGYTVTGRADITQSSIYLDDARWTLATDGLSIALVLNHGWLRGLSWLVLKQTVLWERGRRDTVEFGARVPSGHISAALRDRRVLPLRQLARLGHGAVDPAPYAVTTQFRRKLDIVTDGGALLSVSLDSSVVKRPDQPQAEWVTHRWLELECNQPDRGALASLAGLAGDIGTLLGLAPHHLTKPQCAAAALGWRRSEPPS